MGVIEDVVRSVKRVVDTSLEQWTKVVPVTIVTVSPLTVKVQGGVNAQSATWLTGQTGVAGQTAYAIWHPGRTKPLVFTTRASGDSVWHIIGAAGEPAFESGTSAFGGIYKVPQFMREGNKVFLEGVMNANSVAVGSTIFTLPSGYRPVSGAVIVGCNVNSDTGAASAGTAHTHIMNSLSARLTIGTSGTVQYAGPSATRASSHLSMGGAYFTTD